MQVLETNLIHHFQDLISASFLNFECFLHVVNFSLLHTKVSFVNESG